MEFGLQARRHANTVSFIGKEARQRETDRQQTTGILKAKQEIINCKESGVRDSEETTPKFVFSFCMKELAKRLAANEATTPAIGIRRVRVGRGGRGTREKKEK